MLQYSPEGYLQVLRIRTKKTLLVEGTTDKRVVARVLQELNTEGTTQSVIDTAEIIKGTLGNRQKVEEVFDRATDQGFNIAALVDREFRGFDLTVPFRDEIGDRCFTRGDVLSWTRGHSIENYFFSSSYFMAALKNVFPESLPPLSAVAFEKIVESLIVLAASMSIAGNKHGILNRLRGLATTESFLISAETVSININTFTGQLLERAVTPENINAILADISTYERTIIEKAEVARWICDGHLGMDVLWAGIASYLVHLDTAPAVARAIERGLNDQKLRVFADLWAKDVFQNASVTPQAIWEWEKRSII